MQNTACSWIVDGLHARGESMQTCISVSICLCPTNSGELTEYYTSIWCTACVKDTQKNAIWWCVRRHRQILAALPLSLPTDIKSHIHYPACSRCCSRPMYSFSPSLHRLGRAPMMMMMTLLYKSHTFLGAAAHIIWFSNIWCIYRYIGTFLLLLLSVPLLWLLLLSSLCGRRLLSRLYWNTQHAIANIAIGYYMIWRRACSPSLSLFQ